MQGVGGGFRLSSFQRCIPRFEKFLFIFCYAGLKKKQTDLCNYKAKVFKIYLKLQKGWTILNSNNKNDIYIPELQSSTLARRHAFMFKTNT